MCFFDKFVELCKKKGVSPSRACLDMGLSKSLASKWKQRNQRPNAALLPVISEYFGVSVDELLDVEPQAKKDPRAATDAEVKFALFRGREDITDEMYQEVLAFADYVAAKHGKSEQ